MDEIGAARAGHSAPQHPTATRHIVVFSSPDVAATIGRTGLLEERAGANQVTREPAVRSDVLVQMLSGAQPPDSAPDALCPETSAADAATKLVVMSLYPDLFAADVYRDTASGWLVPVQDLAALEEHTRAWLEAHCELTPPHTPEESAHHLHDVLAGLVDEDRTVVVFNVSTYDPTSRVHHFTPDTPDPYAVRANRLIAALENMAADLGASVVDVDGAIAELGAAEHVPGPGRFSVEAAEFITEDAILLVDQSGALGGSLQAPVMRLEVPPYDRRTVQGTIAKWHVAAGASVSKGDPLFDIRFDGLAYKVEMENPDEDAKRAAKRAAKRREDNAAVLVMQVLAGSGGHVYKLSVPEGTRVSVGDTAAVMTPDVPKGTVAVEASTPAFRLGMKLKEQ